VNEALDQVRRAEHKRLRGQGDTRLTGTKCAWLRRFEDKRCAQALEFRCLFQANLKTSRAWALKESFAAFWDYRLPKAAQGFFDAWSTRAMRSRIAINRQCKASQNLPPTPSMIVNPPFGSQLRRMPALTGVLVRGGDLLPRLDGLADGVRVVAAQR